MARAESCKKCGAVAVTEPTAIMRPAILASAQSVCPTLLMLSHLHIGGELELSSENRGEVLHGASVQRLTGLPLPRGASVKRGGWVLEQTG